MKQELNEPLNDKETMIWNKIMSGDSFVIRNLIAYLAELEDKVDNLNEK